MRPPYSPLTEVRIDPETGQVTSGGAARSQRTAEEGGTAVQKQKCYDQGFRDGHAQGYKEGFEEGRDFGAAEAYKTVDERLRRIEEALAVKI